MRPCGGWVTLTTRVGDGDLTARVVCGVAGGGGDAVRKAAG